MRDPLNLVLRCAVPGCNDTIGARNRVHLCDRHFAEGAEAQLLGECCAPGNPSDRTRPQELRKLVPICTGESTPSPEARALARKIEECVLGISR